MSYVKTFSWEDRPVVSLVDGTPTYRASGAGSCPRSLFFARLGYQPLPASPFLLRAAREGHRHEEWIREDLEEEGIKITGVGDEVSVERDGIRIVAHLDGRAYYVGERFIEIKSMSEFQFQKWKKHQFNDDEFRAYKYQCTACFEVTARPCLYIVKNRSNGEMWRQTYNQPPASIDDVFKHLKFVEESVASMKEPPEECEVDGFVRHTCRWRYNCKDAPKVVTDEEIEAAVKEWEMGKLLSEVGEDKMKESTAKILPFMQSKGVKKLQIGHIIASYFESSKKRSVSIDSLTKALSEVDKELAQKIKSEAITEKPSSPFIRVTRIEV